VGGILGKEWAMVRGSLRACKRNVAEWFFEGVFFVAFSQLLFHIVIFFGKLPDLSCMGDLFGYPPNCYLLFFFYRLEGVLSCVSPRPNLGHEGLQLIRECDEGWPAVV
jgi:hypothetical protein